jgi:hypothetical protein
VRFLIDRYGLSRLLAAVEQRGSFEQALALDLSADFDLLIGQWKERLEERPWWLVILSGSFLSLLFFVAALLAVAAIVRSRLKGRRVYRSLPD